MSPSVWPLTCGASGSSATSCEFKHCRSLKLLLPPCGEQCHYMIWIWLSLEGWAVNLRSRVKVTQRLWLLWQQRSGSLMRRALKISPTWQRISLALCSAKIPGAFMYWYTFRAHITHMWHTFITLRWTFWQAQDVMWRSLGSFLVGVYLCRQQQQHHQKPFQKQDEEIPD